MSYDIHELLFKLLEPEDKDEKDNINETPQDIELNFNKGEIMQRLFMQRIQRSLSTKLICHYIHLDKTMSTDPNDLYNHKFILTPYLNEVKRGNINVIKPITNIKAIRLADFFMYNNAAYSFGQYRINILIKELQTQCFDTYQGNKFHFIASPDTDNSYFSPTYITRHSSYDFNRGWFIFNEMIRHLDTVTINIFDQSKPLSLLNTGSFGISTQAITFKGANATIIKSGTSFLYYVPFYSPMLLTISGFTTTDTISDKTTIDLINGQHYQYTSIIIRNADFDPMRFPIMSTPGPFMWSVMISDQTDILHNYKVILIQDQSSTCVVQICVQDELYVGGVVQSTTQIFTDSFTINTVKTTNFAVNNICTMSFDMNLVDFTFTPVMDTAPYVYGSAVLHATGNNFKLITDTTETGTIILPIRTDTLVGVASGCTITTYNTPMNMKLEIICEDEPDDISPEDKVTIDTKNYMDRSFDKL